MSIEYCTYCTYKHDHLFACRQYIYHRMEEHAKENSVKPSERIDEIASISQTEYPGNTKEQTYIDAIIKYLDEEREK